MDCLFFISAEMLCYSYPFKTTWVMRFQEVRFRMLLVLDILFVKQQQNYGFD